MRPPTMSSIQQQQPPKSLLLVPPPPPPVIPQQQLGVPRNTNKNVLPPPNVNKNNRVLYPTSFTNNIYRMTNSSDSSMNNRGNSNLAYPTNGFHNNNYTPNPNIATTVTSNSNYSTKNHQGNNAVPRVMFPPPPPLPPPPPQPVQYGQTAISQPLRAPTFQQQQQGSIGIPPRATNPVQTRTTFLQSTSMQQQQQQHSLPLQSPPLYSTQQTQTNSTQQQQQQQQELQGFGAYQRQSLQSTYPKPTTHSNEILFVQKQQQHQQHHHHQQQQQQQKSQYYQDEPPRYRMDSDMSSFSSVSLMDSTTTTTNDDQQQASLDIPDAVLNDRPQHMEQSNGYTNRLEQTRNATTDDDVSPKIETPLLPPEQQPPPELVLRKRRKRRRNPQPNTEPPFATLDLSKMTSLHSNGHSQMNHTLRRVGIMGYLVQKVEELYYSISGTTPPVTPSSSHQRRRRQQQQQQQGARKYSDTDEDSAVDDNDDIEQRNSTAVQYDPSNGNSNNDYYSTTNPDSSVTKPSVIVENNYRPKEKPASPFTPTLLLAIGLWYTLGIVSISTSKLLLQRPASTTTVSFISKNPIQAVPPLVLTVQQFYIGTTILHYLMNTSNYGSGLIAFPISPQTHQQQSAKRDHRSQKSLYYRLWYALSSIYYIDSSFDNISPSGKSKYSLSATMGSLVSLELLWAGIFFSWGFYFTNQGFRTSSAAFVETVKAAEPLTSALVAVSYRIETLSVGQMFSLLLIITGVLISTLSSSSSSTATATHDPNMSEAHVSAPWINPNIVSCCIVMGSNLCFSFRGLYQKLYSNTEKQNSNNHHRLDDFNLQYRMQQIGVGMFIVPVLVLYGIPTVIRCIMQYFQSQQSLISLIPEIIGFTISFIKYYCPLAIINGMAFTLYNLASTYILSRISVVYHATFNCIRRIVAIIITSIIFQIPITIQSCCGILTAVSGFVLFTYFKNIKDRSSK